MRRRGLLAKQCDWGVISSTGAMRAKVYRENRGLKINLGLENQPGPKSEVCQDWEGGSTGME